MFCPKCYAEIPEGKKVCPTCGSEQIVNDEISDQPIVLHPFYHRWYEVLNYLIGHIVYFGLIMLCGYGICLWQDLPLLFLLMLFPMYFLTAYVNTLYLEKLYRGVTFTLYKDRISYENDYYPRLNGELYYEEVIHMVAYQNFLDYFFGIGHIKMKKNTKPCQVMLLRNMEHPHEVYETIKDLMKGE